MMMILAEQRGTTKQKQKAKRNKTKHEIEGGKHEVQRVNKNRTLSLQADQSTAANENEIQSKCDGFVMLVEAMKDLDSLEVDPLQLEEQQLNQNQNQQQQ